MKDQIVIRPASCQCSFERGIDPSGKKLICPKPATMKLNQIPLCDTHAEYKMMSVCGRATRIDR